MGIAFVHLRFLHRLRRRWIVWRVMEAAGISAAFGAGVGLFVVLVLMWRQEHALQPAIVLLSIGAIVGMIWGLSRRPTLLQTALMADRQLGLHDLLGTAMLKQQWGDDEFRALVLAEAEMVCRRHSPNELIVRKLGGRAWSGVGITSALVLTLAMMSGRPLISSAGVEIEPTVRGNDSDIVGVANSAGQPVATSFHRETASGQSRSPVDGEEPGDPSGARQGNSSGRATRVNSSGDGAGSSAGRTSDGAAAPLVQNRASGEMPSNDGTQLAGGGRGATNASPGESTGFTANQSNPTTIPPWQSDAWPSDQDAARRSIQSGQVPDSYRDMVREYFQIDRP